MSLRQNLARGEHLIWLTGSALGICLLMILGLLAVILSNGLGIFWPSRIEQLTLKDGIGARRRAGRSGRRSRTPASPIT